jgi:hypothetical protein
MLGRAVQPRGGQPVGAMGRTVQWLLDLVPTCLRAGLVTWRRLAGRGAATDTLSGVLTGLPPMLAPFGEH